MRRLRRIVFFLCVAVFVIVCPRVIFYALGYIVTPGTEHGIVKTGLIHVSTTPPGASVYVGRRRYAKKTPTVIRGLLPGDYPLRLVLKDRQPWTLDVPVEAERASALEHILLLPQVWRPVTLSAEPFESLIPIHGSRVFVLARGPRAGDLVVYDWRDARSQALVPEHSPWHAMKVRSCSVVPGSPAALLQLESRDGERVLWADLKGGETRLQDLTRFFLGVPLRVEWDPRDRRYLYTVYDGHADRLDLVANTVSPKFVNDIEGFGLFDRSLYVLTRDHVVLRVDRDGKRTALLDDPLLGRSLFQDRGVYQIRVLDEEIALLLGERGDLHATRMPYRFVENGVAGLSLYPPRKRALLWQRDRLGILEFARELTAEDAFEPGPILRLVFRQGSDIQQAFWVHEGSHVVFRDGDRITLLELETHGKPRAVRLVDVRPGSAIEYAEESGRLYYLDHSTGRLSAIDLVPRRELPPLPFPERPEDGRQDGEPRR